MPAILDARKEKCPPKKNQGEILTQKQDSCKKECKAKPKKQNAHALTN
jgi:hypothetical protein